MDGGYRLYATAITLGCTLMTSPVWSEPTTMQSAPASTQTPAPGYTSVEQLLDALEQADKDIHTLQADVVYDRINVIQNDRQVRFGELLFQTDVSTGDGQPPKRTFQLVLNKLYVDGRESTEGTTFTFDGELLIEDNSVEKAWTPRRVAAPGSRFDPFRVGESTAMIPLPIGQRKQDILNVYQAELLPAEDGMSDQPKYAEYVAGAYQLRLTPHNPKDHRNKFSDIRLWYRKGSLLPMMSRAVNRAGDISIVQLVNVKLNADHFPRERLVIKAPDPSSGYEVRQLVDDVPGVEDPGRQPESPTKKEGEQP